MKTKLNHWFLFLGGILAVLVAWWAGHSLYLFDGFPKGVDAYAHMARIKWILENFPQINWNPFWDSGTPFWIWTYPPLTALLSAGLIKSLALTMEQGMNLSGEILMLIGSAGLYLAAYMVSSSVPVAIFVSVLTVTTPAFWSWWGHGGNYARIFGLAFYFWSFAFLVWYLKKPSRKRFFLLVVFTSFALGSHMLYGGLIFLTFGAYLLFAVPGWRKKIVTGFKVLSLAFLLSAYWYFPLFLTSKPGGRYVEGAFGSAVTFKDLFFLDVENLFFSLPTQFTVITLACVILGFILLIAGKYQERLSRAVVLGLGLGVLGSLFYILIGNIPNYPEKGYLAVFPPFATLPLFIFFSAYFIAGMFSGLSRRLASILAGLLTVFVLIFFVLSLPFPRASIYDISQPGNPQFVAQQLMAPIPLTADYRFGTDSAFVADWFNYLYPQLPQTRDYIYQGIPFKQWQFFWEWLVWTQPDRFLETQFLFDWYGVKYFTVGFASVNTQHDKFLDHPELFEKLAESPENYFYVFAYKDPTPIASFVDVPTMLMIGGREEYETLVRTLALSNLGTRKIIPAYGGKKLSLSLDELKKFDIVFLYQYQAKNLALEMEPLAEFVRQGGLLLVESNREAEGDENLFELPEPFPMTGIDLEERQNDWSLNPALEFSPALFGRDPWKIKVAKGIKPGVKTILTSKGEPVILMGELGQGKVIWSGINLPYHALSFQNQRESDYFGQLLETGLGEPLKVKKEEKVKFSLWQPERRVLEMAADKKGLLLKESHFPQWQAKLATSDPPTGGLTTSLKIYTAGPNLMYLPFPRQKEVSGKIVLDYRLSLMEKIGWLTSFVTLTMMVLYLAGKTPKFLAKLNFWRRIGRLGLKSWWDKDDEENY